MSNCVLGAMHSGAGNVAVNKILACANIPSVSNVLYKRYEKFVETTIEKEAQNSCKRAAFEERQLVIQNIEKMNEIL